MERITVEKIQLAQLSQDNNFDVLAVRIEASAIDYRVSLHDGKRFLCQRFSMGRLVRTKQNVVGSGRSRVLARP